MIIWIFICWIVGHDWENDEHFPIRGYYNQPYKDSYCDRCGIRPRQ